MPIDPISVYRTAVQRVPAYRRFLEEKLGRVPEVQSIEDFAALPLTDKLGYVARYRVSEVCLDGTLAGKHVVVRTSGSSGEPLFFPQLPEQERGAGAWLMDDLESLLGIRSEPALAVVCLALGGWMSGVLACTLLRNIASEYGCMMLATPGYNLDETVKILRQLCPEFKQTILFAYPPFAKAILEAARDKGVAIEKHRIALRLMGEGFSERYRDHLMQLLGYDEREAGRIWSGYGAADFGRIGKETPLCIAVRRLLHHNGKTREVLGSDELPTIVQFNTSSFYLELVDDELVITRHQAVPLVRYRTCDRGSIISYAELMTRMQDAGMSPRQYLREHGVAEQLVQELPFVLLQGRANDSLKFLGAHIRAERVRDIIESSAVLNPLLTGNFELSHSEDAALQPVLEICAEAREDPSRLDAAELGRVLGAELARREPQNTAAIELLNGRALLRIKLVPSGTLLQDTKVRYIRS
jgi:phenylacetate-CoA ligase